MLFDNADLSFGHHNIVVGLVRHQCQPRQVLGFRLSHLGIGERRRARMMAPSSGPLHRVALLQLEKVKWISKGESTS